MIKLFLLYCITILPLISQGNDSLFLRVVIPEKDTVHYGLYRHRIAASTGPAMRAFINYKEVKVYPSGAFVGFHFLTADTSMLHISVKNANGDSLWKDYVFLKPIPTAYTEGEIYIDNISSPSEDRWLTNGDVLEVRMRGTPGQQPEFEIEGIESSIPMRELIGKNGNGPGNYIGQYKIKPIDQCADAAVTVRIKKNFFSSEEAIAKGKVSIIQDSLPRTAELTGKRPYLNAGLGTDRLGGAKLGFLVEGVRVVVTGKSGTQYRVKLSDGMEGWLPQENALLLPVNTPLPFTLTGSITISGNDNEDVVRIAMGQKVSYTSEQTTEPMSIIVNIFGAASNTNWITHHLSAAGVQQVQTTQVGAEHIQLTIMLKHKQHWGYDIGYEGTTLRIRVRRPPVIADTLKPLAKLTIGIDAGHGIGNEGAKGATGAVEKDITLSIAKELKALLQSKGIKTVMTRESDWNVGNNERIDKMLNAGVHLFVSIHANSIGENADPEAVKGTSAYFRYPGFKPLSDIIYRNMLSLGLSEWGVTGNFNFSLSGATQYPNVLVETAFMSNPEDEMKLIDENFRKQIAQKIVDGLEEFVRTYAR